MATTPPLRLNRQQLAQFLKDQEQIRAFENLFGLVEPLAPDTLSDLQVNVGNAQATANQAVSALNRIAAALDLLASAPAIRNDSSVVTDYIDFATAAPDPAVKVGRLHWNGGYTLNLDMTPNVSQSIGESQYFYIKASGAITKGQLIMFDGSVGASGVLKGKPATGVTNGQLIMGIAAETLALNDFGLVTNFGLVRGFNTTGTPYSETWADGDILYYNPAVAGGLTKTLPAAPTPHVVVAAVVNAASGGSGSVFVRVTAEPLVSQLSDVFISGLANGDVLQYDGVQQRWENIPAASLPAGIASNLAGGAAGSVPYQTAPDTTAFLAIGANNRVLTSNGTSPQWSAGLTLTTLTASGTVSFSGGTVTLGSSTGATTVGLGTGATTNGTTKTINIGTAGVSGSTTNINIGSAVSGATTNVTLNAGAANGVPYLNASKVLTSGAALTFDGTDLATTGTATATKFVPTGNVTAGNGMYLPAANTLAWSTNGVEGMRLDANGDFGVGNGSAPARGDLDISAGNTTTTQTRSLHFGYSSSDFYGWRIAATNTPTTTAAGTLTFQRGTTAAWVDAATFDDSGNLLLGGTASPASATQAFAIFNGTAPTGSVANGCVLYTEDVSSSSELKVRDEAGNVTTLSPHNFSLIPEGPSEDMAWSYYSERDGKRINIDMLKAIRVLERISGEKLVFEAT